MTGPDGAQQHITPGRQVLRILGVTALAVVIVVVYAAAIAAVMNRG
jgi:hypothetical protein